MKITIEQAALLATKERSLTKAFQVLNWMEDKSFANPEHFPLICDITRAGEEGHSWAWDTLEEWKWDGVDEENEYE